MANLQEFQTITIYLPEWAHKILQEAAQYRCLSVDYMIGFLVRGTLLGWYNEKYTGAIEKRELASSVEAWLDVKNRLFGRFKRFQRRLSGKNLPKPIYSIDLTLSTLHKVEISLRNIWIHFLEKQVGSDSEKVAQRIAEIVINRLREWSLNILVDL